MQFELDFSFLQVASPAVPAIRLNHLPALHADGIRDADEDTARHMPRHRRVVPVDDRGGPVTLPCTRRPSRVHRFGSSGWYGLPPLRPLLAATSSGAWHPHDCAEKGDAGERRAWRADGPSQGDVPPTP